MRTTIIWLSVSIFWITAALAQTVTVTGTAAIISGNVASAREQALSNAQRLAIEQGVGVMIDSETIAENFQIIKDSIYTSSRGLIESYTILAEGRRGSAYSVSIEATVSNDLLAARLEALHILHSKMGNRRMLIVYRPQNSHALPADHGAVRAAIQELQSQFSTHGFRVFDEKTTFSIYQNINPSNNPGRIEDEMTLLALENQAELLVDFEIVAGQKLSTQGMFSAVFATLNLAVIDTLAGRLISSNRNESKQLIPSRSGPYDREKGLATAAEKAADKAVKESVAQISQYYAQVDNQGFPFLISFSGFNEDQEDRIINALENLPGVNKLVERRNTNLYLEVELFSNSEPSRFRRLIRNQLKIDNLNAKIEFSRGYHLAFSQIVDQPLGN